MLQSNAKTQREPSILTRAYNYDWALTLIIILAYFTAQLTWWAARFGRVDPQHCPDWVSPSRDIFAGVEAGGNGGNQHMSPAALSYAKRIT